MHHSWVGLRRGGCGCDGTPEISRVDANPEEQHVCLNYAVRSRQQSRAQADRTRSDRFSASLLVEPQVSQITDGFLGAEAIGFRRE